MWEILQNRDGKIMQTETQVIRGMALFFLFISSGLALFCIICVIKKFIEEYNVPAIKPKMVLGKIVRRRAKR